MAKLCGDGRGRGGSLAWGSTWGSGVSRAALTERTGPGCGQATFFGGEGGVGCLCSSRCPPIPQHFQPHRLRLCTGINPCSSPPPELLSQCDRCPEPTLSRTGNPHVPQTPGQPDPALVCGRRLGPGMLGSSPNVAVCHPKTHKSPPFLCIFCVSFPTAGKRPARSRERKASLSLSQFLGLIQSPSPLCRDSS